MCGRTFTGHLCRAGARFKECYAHWKSSRGARRGVPLACASRRRRAPTDARHLEQRRPTVTLHCIVVGDAHGRDVERKKEILALSVDRHITLQDCSTAPGTSGRLWPAVRCVNPSLPWCRRSLVIETSTCQNISFTLAERRHVTRVTVIALQIPDRHHYVISRYCLQLLGIEFRCIVC